VITFFNRTAHVDNHFLGPRQHTIPSNTTGGGLQLVLEQQNLPVQPVRVIPEVCEGQGQYDGPAFERRVIVKHEEKCLFEPGGRGAF
jgi:hypothetical protein